MEKPSHTSALGESVFPSWLLENTWGGGWGRGPADLMQCNRAELCYVNWASSQDALGYGDVAVVVLTSWVEPVEGVA